MSFSERVPPVPPVDAAADESAGPVRRRVLVVDDSAFMRRLVSEVVQSSGEFEVVGTARDGEDALQHVAALNPDLVTLDVDMPGLDGLGALTRIMQEHPRPVVMLSAGTTHGGMDATLQALERGAVDFVRKPSGAISLDLDLVREQLLQALRGAASVRLTSTTVVHGHRVTRADTAGAARAQRPDVGMSRAPRVVVAIAASTGGPAALAQVIPQLPRLSDAAVVVVQHMPIGFTASFARRLDGAAAMRVREAGDAEPLLAGHVYVAPGGRHLRVRGPSGAPTLVLGDEAPLWGVRPAADLLFASVAEVFGSHAVGVVLTGMGRDGADGLRRLADAGARAIVQDAESSIIPGMPDAARRALAVSQVASRGAESAVPLDDVAAAIERAVRVVSTGTGQ